MPALCIDENPKQYEDYDCHSRSRSVLREGQRFLEGRRPHVAMGGLAAGRLPQGEGLCQVQLRGDEVVGVNIAICLCTVVATKKTKPGSLIAQGLSGLNNANIQKFLLLSSDFLKNIS